MSDPLKSRFAVPMPEAGEGAYLLFARDLTDITALEAGLGEEFVSICEIAFRHPAPSVIARALAICLKDGDACAAPWGLSLQELGRRLYDAELRSIRGISLEEAEAAIAEAAE